MKAEAEVQGFVYVSLQGLQFSHVDFRQTPVLELVVLLSWWRLVDGWKHLMYNFVELHVGSLVRSVVERDLSSVKHRRG